jgi:hypothetical protein
VDLSIGSRRRTKVASSECPTGISPRSPITARRATGECTIANGPKLSAGVIIPKKGLLEMKKVLFAIVESGIIAYGPRPRAS